MSTGEVHACRDLYLDLLKRSLSDTLFHQEPAAENKNTALYVGEFIEHYIKGSALTMIPLCRLDNLRACVEQTIEDAVPGDLIETGVWRGGATIFMRGILRAHGDEQRCVWVADSFEGLPEPDPQRFPKEAALHRSPTIQRGYKNLAVTLDEVRANFEAYGFLDQQTRFLKGWFRESLPNAPIQRLALMRLDGDYYESTMDALVNLYDKLSVGGIVIIDDYGEDAWTNCRQAVDDFRRTRSIVEPMVAVDSKCYWWRRTSGG